MLLCLPIFISPFYQSIIQAAKHANCLNSLVITQPKIHEGSQGFFVCSTMKVIFVQAIELNPMKGYILRVAY